MSFHFSLLFCIFGFTYAFFQTCGPCYCQESTGIISCASLSLRQIPKFSTQTKAFAKVLNLRSNYITSVDMKELSTFKKLRLIDLRDNEIDCFHIDKLREKYLVESECENIQDLTTNMDIVSSEVSSELTSSSDKDKFSTLADSHTPNDIQDEEDDDDDNIGVYVLVVFTSASTTSLLWIGCYKLKDKVG